MRRVLTRQDYGEVFKMTGRAVPRVVEPAEELVDLAAYGFRVACETCLQCRDYHAVWGYERLARVKGNGFESERDILGILFRDYTPQRGRIMIAGAADAGLLALIAQEARYREPRITVVDRCVTPLSICRRFAASHDLKIATAQQDLASGPFTPSHTLALAHNVLLHMPVPQWSEFLRNTRLSLDRGGVLVLVQRVKASTPSANLRPPPAEYAERTLTELSARNIALPEAEARFRRRLEDYSESKSSWSDPSIGADYLESLLIGAGFAIARRIDHDRRRTAPSRDGGEATSMATHIFVAINA